MLVMTFCQECYDVYILVCLFFVPSCNTCDPVLEKLEGSGSCNYHYCRNTKLLQWMLSNVYMFSFLALLEKYLQRYVFLGLKIVKKVILRNP
jgi:hypothetical protein